MLNDKEVIADVLHSLKNEPTRWSYNSIMKGYKSYKFMVYRDDGLSLWVGNKAYGVNIGRPGKPEIGKVYFWWFPFGGAPWQHKIYNAYKEWDNG